MPVRILETYDPSAVDDFRSLKGKGGHFEKGLFIAEGAKVTEKFLESTYEIPVAFLTPEHFERLSPFFERRSDVTDVYLAPKPAMEQIIGYPLHQGAMLAVRIPRTRSLHVAATEWHEPFTVVALDSIADAENMGAIIRTAAAFDAVAVLIDDQSCDPFLRRSVRVSMGNIVDIEIIRVNDLTKALVWLREKLGATIIGTALSERSRVIDNAPVTTRQVFVFGSEGWGLRKEVEETCDMLVQIPISPKVDSLNVAIASGIFLHHFSNTRI